LLLIQRHIFGMRSKQLADTRLLLYPFKSLERNLLSFASYCAFIAEMGIFNILSFHVTSAKLFLYIYPTFLIIYVYIFTKHAAKTKKQY